MTPSPRALYPGAALLIGLAGSARAAEDKGAAKAPAHDPHGHDTGKTGAASGSVGAGGLTGSGAMTDGARTGGRDKPASASPSAPAAGTTR